MDTVWSVTKLRFENHEMFSPIRCHVSIPFKLIVKQLYVLVFKNEFASAALCHLIVSRVRCAKYDYAVTECVHECALCTRDNADSALIVWGSHMTSPHSLL